MSLRVTIIIDIPEDWAQPRGFIKQSLYNLLTGWRRSERKAEFEAGSFGSVLAGHEGKGGICGSWVVEETR